MNSIVTGLLAYLAASFFAGGTIAENFSGEEVYYPEFYMTMAVWGLGVIVGLFLYFSKIPGLFLTISILITWIAIPAGINIGWNLAFS
ncbi:hypothetical protein [Halobacillus salinus]|uniref:Uncharacterized protein n=1 Tax=Halobacillus salinus TaxID=192814 RepID=A0A4Z0H187_9BACI|nr:hypothetical protein [Halobacillus salinus]TGB03644.1 hypothetical protein E4663_01165 [Halobacillus salinus]